VNSTARPSTAQSSDWRRRSREPRVSFLSRTIRVRLVGRNASINRSLVHLGFHPRHGKVPLRFVCGLTHVFAVSSGSFYLLQKVLPFSSQLFYDVTTHKTYGRYNVEHTTARYRCQLDCESRNRLPRHERGAHGFLGHLSALARLANSSMQQPDQSARTYAGGLWDRPGLANRRECRPHHSQRECMYRARTLTHAEQCLCSADIVHRLPTNTSFEQGASLGISHLTAYRTLLRIAQARAGESVLVQGAGGGVGLAAVQFARACGLQSWERQAQRRVEILSCRAVHITFKVIHPRI
jgi:hypothetical protein